MALKDWNKDYEQKESPGMSWGAFYRKGQKWIRLWRPASSYHKGFRMVIGKGKMGAVKRKSFKTKAQTIKYAKEYMKNN